MKRSTAYITGLAVVTASLFFPVPIFAQMKVGNVLIPSGFCQEQTVDGVRYLGVRFDGVTYQLWLDENSLGADRLEEMVKQANAQRRTEGLPPFSELEEGQFVANAKKAEARFQMTQIRRGQDALCPFVK